MHDAARPLAGDALFAAVIDGRRVGRRRRGARAGRSRTRSSGSTATRVVETVPRDDLVAVQTPQAFRAGALRAAHTDEGDGTDDAALVEAAGGTVVVVPGEATNLKITGPEDLMLVTALLALGSGA